MEETHHQDAHECAAELDRNANVGCRTGVEEGERTPWDVCWRS